jgi:hypothetical protein
MEKANDFLPLRMLCFLCVLCGKKNNLRSFWRNLFFSIDANPAKTGKRNKLLFSTHILSLQDNLDDM